MPQLAANISLLFPQLPFLERFAAAARAGFGSVEYQFPYAWPPEAVAERARAAGVQVVLHNLPAGDPEKGDRGIACLPERVAEFREGVERAIEYAQAAGCPRLNALAGIAPAGVAPELLFETLVENVSFAASRLNTAGLALMLEPINPRQALEVLDAAGAANAFLQYDIFHMQLADVPDRHEPGTGEINFDFLLRHIDRVGYAGWIGCEYNPLGDTSEGLAWAKPYLRRA